MSLILRGPVGGTRSKCSSRRVCCSDPIKKGRRFIEAQSDIIVGAGRVSHLHGRMSGCLLALVAGCLLQGCGLLIDAAKLLKPVVPDLGDELDVICRHQRLQVGIAVEAFPPFVFPVAWTDQGSMVTGLDIELVREITGALSRHCGGSPVTAVPHMVHYRDLFRLLAGGHLDLFVSSVSYNVLRLSASGLGYS